MVLHNHGKNARKIQYNYQLLFYHGTTGIKPHAIQVSTTPPNCIIAAQIYNVVA